MCSSDLIVGELLNSSYRLNEMSYTMERHGFARTLLFETIAFSDDVVEMELCASEETRKIYPFHFSLKIRYEIIENSIVATMAVFNPDAVTLPFSLGAHPAFLLQEGMKNYSIEFEQQEVTKRYFVSNGLLSPDSVLFETKGNELILNTDLFDEDAIIFKSLKSKSMVIKNKSKPFVKMEWDNSFTHFGIWSKRNCNHFVCLEPWAGVADSQGFNGDFTVKEGIINLPPLHTKKFQFTCTFY